VYRTEVEENLMVCPACGFHFRIGARDRLEVLLDPESFVETHSEVQSADPLQFTVGKETYAQRLERAQNDTGLDEAISARWIPGSSWPAWAPPLASGSAAPRAMPFASACASCASRLRAARACRKARSP
jgi:hypothetical protein